MNELLSISLKMWANKKVSHRHIKIKIYSPTDNFSVLDSNQAKYVNILKA